MDKKQFLQILKKYRQGSATPEEARFVEAYYNLFETMDVQTDDSDIKDEVLEKIWNTIQLEEGNNGVKMRKLFSPTLKIAAAILAFLALGITMYSITLHRTIKRGTIHSVAGSNLQDSIYPAGNKAVLTLANGHQIMLDSVRSESLPVPGTRGIIKMTNGKLIYQQSSMLPDISKMELPVSKNTLTTPRGGEYQLVLPDGSQVWLNAASSITFPTAFTGSTRTVDISGEAYFEIAGQADKPFMVKTDGMLIEVLGTHFNVNAYKEEKTIRTTLSEGVVKVSHLDNNGNRKYVKLKPGEQASLNKKMGDIKVNEVNLEAALAWKNGLFYFENTNIKAIMDEVTRWYNVDVVYETADVENKNFSGVVSRYSDVEALLNRLESTGTVHFEIIGRKIMVSG